MTGVDSKYGKLCQIHRQEPLAYNGLGRKWRFRHAAEEGQEPSLSAQVMIIFHLFSDTCTVLSITYHVYIYIYINQIMTYSLERVI